MGAVRAIQLAETTILKRIMKNPAVTLRITNHARAEMAHDGIVDADLRHVLLRNGVTWSEAKKDLLWHVEGKDIDGRSIRLVIAVYEVEIVVKLVTAMKL